MDKQVEVIKHSIPIDEELALHKKGWVIQRVGWVMIFLFMLLALLGLFGEGPLSSRTVAPGDIKISYDRFGRFEHETAIKLESSGEDISSISLSEQYIRNFKVTKIVPEPGNPVVSAGYINYTFPGHGNRHITLYLDPTDYGNSKGSIKVNNYTISLAQTIYP